MPPLFFRSIFRTSAPLSSMRLAKPVIYRSTAISTPSPQVTPTFMDLFSFNLSSLPTLTSPLFTWPPQPGRRKHWDTGSAATHVLQPNVLSSISQGRRASIATPRLPPLSNLHSVPGWRVLTRCPLMSPDSLSRRHLSLGYEPSPLLPPRTPLRT